VETKEIWQVDAMWDPGLDSEKDKRHSLENRISEGMYFGIQFNTNAKPLGSSIVPLMVA
jgi:hypothetical protein